MKKEEYKQTYMSKEKAIDILKQAVEEYENNRDEVSKLICVNEGILALEMAIEALGKENKE